MRAAGPARALLVALALGAGLACARRPEMRPPILAPGRAPPSAPGRPEACARIEHLVVRKSERRLMAQCTGGVRFELPIALAREHGAKRESGDNRMPEGEYRIAGPARRSRFHRFIPIDYPSAADAERALAEGRISAEEREAIVRAHAQGSLPPQDTGLGGHLGLHGEGDRWRGDLALDWTEGCVAVSDEAIDLLARRAPPGTPVHIHP